MTTQTVLAVEKWCRGCEAFRPADRFGKAPRIPDGLKARCRDCVNKNRKRRQNEPPDEPIQPGEYVIYKGKDSKERTARAVSGLAMDKAGRAVYVLELRYGGRTAHVPWDADRVKRLPPRPPAKRAKKKAS